jgi:hypothetical protein
VTEPTRTPFDIRYCWSPLAQDGHVAAGCPGHSDVDLVCCGRCGGVRTRGGFCPDCVFPKPVAVTATITFADAPPPPPASSTP